MIIRKIRRFLRRGRFSALLAGVILSLGFSAAAVAFNVIRAFERPQDSGLRADSFATVARQTSAGGLSAINWNLVLRFEQTLHIPQSVITGYARPTNYEMQWQQKSYQVAIAFTEPIFFTKFTNGLLAGHTFSPDWESGAQQGEVIVSDDFGRHFFGSIQNSLNQKVRIAGQTFTVVGVAPRGFGGLWARTDMWSTPDEADKLGTSAFRTEITNRDAWKLHNMWYLLVAASPEIRPAPVKTLSRQLRSKSDQYLHLQAVGGLTDDPVSDRNVRSASQLGLIVAIALLLSAALNYCVLLIARSSLFVEEFRLKRVLGASPGRLIMDETVGPLFVVILGFAASGVVTIAVQHVLKLREMNPIVAVGLGIDSAVTSLAVEFILAVLMGLSISVVPALSLICQSGTPMAGMTTTRGRRQGFVLKSIVVVEIAACTLVCLFAATFVREYFMLSKVELGYVPDSLFSFESNIATKGGGLLSFQTSSGNDFPMQDFVRLSMSEAQHRVPGLQAIAAAGCTPFGPPMKTIDLYPLQKDAEPVRGVALCAVSQSFFSTMKMHIREGSGFKTDDYNGYVSHVLVNESLARELWSQQDAMNQTLHLDEPASNLSFDASVVGVTDDVRQAGATSSPQPTIYLPLTGNAYVLSFPIYFLARGNPLWSTFEEIVQKQSSSTVKSLGIVRSFSVQEKVDKGWQAQERRLNLALFGAILVATIAYIGLYGVLVHSVLARQKELALRVAFGASRWAVQRVVIQTVLLCCLAAIGIALLLWRICFGLMNSGWGDSATWSWAASIGTALLCAVISGLIAIAPSLRAMRTSPASLLKNE